MKTILLTIIVVFLVSCSNQQKPVSESVDNLFYDRAYDFLDAGKQDSAFYYFDKARSSYLEAKDSLGVASALTNMAITQQEFNDYFGSQETSLQALAYLREKDPKAHDFLAMNYNNLAIASDRLGDNEKAIPYYQKALQYSKDSISRSTYRNNLGVCLRRLGRYKESLALFEESFEKAEKGSLEYARVLTNKASVLLLMDPSYPALKDYQETLSIRRNKKDSLGMSSSYAYISKYYESRNLDSAIYYAEKRYAIAKAKNYIQDREQGLKQLIHLGPDTRYKAYFADLNYLKDSIDQARLSARNQFAMIRYEVEKSKSENLQLQKDKAEVSYKLTWFRLGLILLLIFSALGIFWFKRNQKRLALIHENQMKASQLKTSKKVHDVVANGIYRVMNMIEHQEQVDREQVLDQLEDMYNQSRDISHEGMERPAEVKPFNIRLADLFKSFGTEDCRILSVGNDPETWTNVPKPIQEELKHILQELMVNMRKHSRASTVIVRFTNEAQVLQINYSDNGIGMPDKDAFGKGLQNTVSRIETCNGHITFDSEKEQGLKVEIRIPLITF